MGSTPKPAMLTSMPVLPNITFFKIIPPFRGTLSPLDPWQGIWSKHLPSEDGFAAALLLAVLTPLHPIPQTHIHAFANRSSIRLYGKGKKKKRLSLESEKALLLYFLAETIVSANKVQGIIPCRGIGAEPQGLKLFRRKLCCSRWLLLLLLSQGRQRLFSPVRIRLH